MIIRHPPYILTLLTK